MAIKIRRGKYSDYDPSKLVSGELAVVLEGDPNSKTGRSLYVCFQPGTVKRIVDYDDLVDLLANASDTYVEKISDEYLSNINTATDSANKAASSATAASESATSAAGNANKAASEASTQAERAETALAGLGSAITSDKVKNNLTTTDEGYVLDARQGKVLSDRVTTVENDISSPTAVTNPTDKTVLLKGGSGIDYAKLADAIIARYNANALINNVTTKTAATGALDAAQGKALSDRIAGNTTDIATLNNSLANKVDTATLQSAFENNWFPSRLPSGFNSTDKQSMFTLKNGLYYHTQFDGTLNFPSEWGFMIKIGFKANEEYSDFNAVYFTQASGSVYRCSGNVNRISGWVQI